MQTAADYDSISGSAACGWCFGCQCSGLRCCCKIGEFVEQERFDWRAQSEIADLANGLSVYVSDHFTDGQAAKTALTWSHAAAAETFELIGPRQPQINNFANLTGCDLFSAADNGLIFRRDTIAPCGSEQSIQEGTQAHLCTKQVLMRLRQCFVLAFINQFDLVLAAFIFEGGVQGAQ